MHSDGRLGTVGLPREAQSLVRWRDARSKQGQQRGRGRRVSEGLGEMHPSRGRHPAKVGEQLAADVAPADPPSSETSSSSSVSRDQSSPEDESGPIVAPVVFSCAGS